MIVVEPAVDSDCFAIEKLDKLAWDESATDIVMSDSNYTWRVWIENALVFTVKKDQAIVAVALAFPTKSGSYCLHKILTHPKWREHHFASNLLATILHETDKLRVPIFVNVFSHNEKALALFRKHGFFEDVEKRAANRLTNTTRLSRSAKEKPHFSAHNYLSSLYQK